MESFGYWPPPATASPDAGAWVRPIERRRDTSVNSGTTDPARILIVEDQDDVRRMLTTALSIEGHHVDEASSAAEGLQRLEQARYHLVLSDYAMPGGTGAWMLHQATERGLLNGAVALIITAHPDVRELENVEVITKPLDLDNFLEQVRRILATEREGGHASPAPAEMPRSQVRNRHRIELVLYVSSESPSSIQARRNLERLLEQFDMSQVRYTVCDLVRDPLGGDADRIAFTPTLVKRYPEPKMWVLGNLREPEILADLLRVCGVDGIQ
jgi:two-component system response regulator GlrR